MGLTLGHSFHGRGHSAEQMELHPLTILHLLIIEPQQLTYSENIQRMIAQTNSATVADAHDINSATSLRLTHKIPVT